MPTASAIPRSCGWLRYRAGTRRKRPTPSCARITASWPASRGPFWKDCPSIKTMPNSTPCWMPPFVTSTRRRLPEPSDEAKHELLEAICGRAGRQGKTAQNRSRLRRPRRDREGRAGGDEEVVQKAPQASGLAVQRETALRADRPAGARHGGQGRRDQPRPRGHEPAELPGGVVQETGA